MKGLRGQADPVPQPFPGSGARFTFSKPLGTLVKMDQVAIGPAKEPIPSRAWYQASVAEFLGAAPMSVLGTLSGNSVFADDPAQKDAWKIEIEFLQTWLQGLSGALFLQFNIPRMAAC